MEAFFALSIIWKIVAETKYFTPKYFSMHLLRTNRISGT